MSKLLILNAGPLEEEEFANWSEEWPFCHGHQAFFGPFFNSSMKQDVKLNYLKKDTLYLLYFACNISAVIHISGAPN